MPANWVPGGHGYRDQTRTGKGYAETDRGGRMQNSVNAGPSLLSPKNQDGKPAKKTSLFQGMNISPKRRAQVRAELERDFSCIFDPAINEVDPAVHERDPAAGVA